MKNPFNPNSYGWFAHKHMMRAIRSYIDYPNEDTFYEGILVDCHQFCEKIMKHELQVNQGILEEGHSLKKLLNKCIVTDTSLDKFKRAILILQNVYYDKRYPGENFELTTKEEVAEAVELVIRVRDYFYTKYPNTDFPISNRFQD